MNSFQWMLSLHVASAAFVAGWGFALFVLALRAPRLGEHRRSLDAFITPVGRFGTLPATALLLATGIWLATTLALWRSPWLWVSLALLLVYGGVFERTTRKAARALASDPSAAATGRFRTQAILQAICLFAILVLMTARPF